MNLTVMGDPTQGMRIKALDGWRGIAILLVIADHMQCGFFRGAHPYGFIGQHGVTLFFVLSGFLITSKLLSELQANGRISLARFCRRRFWRLMPAAWAYMLVVGFVFAHTEFAPPLHEWLAAVFFYRNYVHPTQLLLQHFWSLSIEEQFYLAWPALLLIARPRRSLVIASVLVIGIEVWRWWNWNALMADPLKSHFTQFRADSLLIGCIAAIILADKPFRISSRVAYALLGGFAVCCVAVQVVIPAVESMLIAVLICGRCEWFPRRILEASPMVFIGRISYSLYLWQSVFLTTPIKGFLSLIVRLACAFAFATLSFYLLEKPLRSRVRVAEDGRPEDIAERVQAKADVVVAG